MNIDSNTVKIEVVILTIKMMILITKNRIVLVVTSHVKPEDFIRRGTLVQTRDHFHLEVITSTYRVSLYFVGDYCYMLFIWRDHLLTLWGHIFFEITTSTCKKGSLSFGGDHSTYKGPLLFRRDHLYIQGITFI